MIRMDDILITLYNVLDTLITVIITTVVIIIIIIIPIIISLHHVSVKYSFVITDFKCKIVLRIVCNTQNNYTLKFCGSVYVDYPTAHACINMVLPVVPADEVEKILHSKVLMIEMDC